MATTREEQRQATATKVLTAADELFRTQGFADTTIRDIAAACDMSVGTVMAVGDKNALLIATFDQTIKRIHRERARTSGTSQSVTCVDHVAELFDPFVELFASHPTLARAYGSVLVAGNHAPIIFTELSSVLIREIAATLHRWNRADANHVSSQAEGIYFAYIGRLFTWPLGNDGDAAELKHSLRRIVAAHCQDEEPEK